MDDYYGWLLNCLYCCQMRVFETNRDLTTRFKLVLTRFDVQHS